MHSARTVASVVPRPPPRACRLIWSTRVVEDGIARAASGGAVRCKPYLDNKPTCRAASRAPPGRDAAGSAISAARVKKLHS
jgi:hypothetical protein